MNDHVGKPFELNHLVALLLRLAPRMAQTQPDADSGAPAVAPRGTAIGDPSMVLDVTSALARMGECGHCMCVLHVNFWPTCRPSCSSWGL
jgi:hypothetical protein